jgi:teichoic acid transport system permease protein
VSDRPTTASPGLIRLGEVLPLRLYVQQLWGRRGFAVAVAKGELRAKHLDTLLGNLWHLLNPLLLIGVYYLVFGVILNASRGVENFVGFLAIGILAYNFTQRAVMGGAASIANNEGLIRSLQFPRALLPISSVMRESIAFGSSAVVMLAVAVVTGEPISILWFIAIPAILLQVVFNIGIAFFFARLADKVKDVLNVIPYIFRIFFYLSGILFSVDVFLPRVDEQFQTLPLHEMFILNPFYVFVSLPREYIMATESHAFVPQMWMSAVGWALVAFILGLLFFRAGERDYGRG